MKTDILIRLVACAGVLVLMASWEVLAPRRRLGTSKLRRWTDHLTVLALNTMVVRLVFGTGAVGAAIVVTGQGWGLLNRVSWPLWFEIVLVVVLDFILYLQHVIFHAVPVFWRFHMMHHADLDCDVTTGVRFLPVEVAMTIQGCPGEEWALKAYRAYKECLMGRPTDQTALCCEHAGSEA